MFTSEPLTPRPVLRCASCQGELRRIGRLPIHADAVPRGLLIPAESESDTPAVGVDTYRCTDCGHLEFFDHDFQLPSA